MFDLAVVGAGPGGYIAALRAASNGLKVVIIDDKIQLGGTCLNQGCIPTKRLLHDSYLIWQHRQMLSVEGHLEDFKSLIDSKNDLVETIGRSLKNLFESKKIKVVKSRATFIDPQTLSTLEGQIKAKNILVAVGSKPVEMSSLPLGDKIWNSDQFLRIEQLPPKIAIIGSGVIGLEMASICLRMGSKVSIIEQAPKILPFLDEEISLEIQKSFQNKDVNFHLGVNIQGYELKDEHIILNSEQGHFECDAVLVAVGRVPNTFEMGLDKLGIECDSKGFIKVDGFFRTSCHNIFAIGDCIDGPMLAHKASEEALSVADYMIGKRYEINYTLIPNVIYIEPEVASVGFTENELKKLNIEFKSVTYQLKHNSRSMCSHQDEGIVKILIDKKHNTMIGFQMFAPHASEIVCWAILAIASKMSIDELAKLPFAHPTISESIKESLTKALGQPIHG